MRLVIDEPQAEQVATRTELADRMVMLGAQQEEKELRPYRKKIDIPRAAQDAGGVIKRALAGRRLHCA